MAKGKAIGCFGLTEPEAGSDPASMKTFARKEGSSWVINGSKRWIGMGSIADVAVLWARTDEEGNPVRGFVVPTSTPGFEARDITGKFSMRSSIQCDLTFEEMRLPESAMLPDIKGLKGPLPALTRRGTESSGARWAPPATATR
jgi:glutaryl-CoA dehydrogenase